MTANGNKISFGVMKYSKIKQQWWRNDLKIKTTERVNLMVCKLYLNKSDLKKWKSIIMEIWTLNRALCIKITAYIEKKSLYTITRES